MQDVLKKYLPSQAVEPIFELIKINGVYLKIVNQRQTKHGDYRRLPSGEHIITINNSLNKYRFLMTLVHEIAHLVAFQKFGRTIKPHGKEWKYTFQKLMLPFIRPEIFPNSILPLIARHFKNPTASSDTDARLSVALQQYDEITDNTTSYIYQLPLGTKFRISNGKVFQKGYQKIKRYECIEIATGQMYLFQPNAKVEALS